MRRAASLIVALSAIALHAQTTVRDNPPQQTGIGVIRGRVVSLDGGDALRNARVTLAGTAAAPPRVFTDSSGAFVFPGLPFGRYTVTVRKAGYAPTRFGARRPAEPASPVQISAQTPSAAVVVRMPRSAAISGRILDDLGDPIELARVAAERIVRTDGRTATATIATATTDDLGEYRLGGLPDGRYVVSAQRTYRGSRTVSVNGSQLVETPYELDRRVYYPGASTVTGAQPVDVAVGEQRTAVDFVIRDYPPTTPILKLSFVDAIGRPASALSYVVDRADTVAAAIIDAPTIGDRIEQRLESGSFLLVARNMLGPGTAIVPVSIGSADVEMTVTLRAGGRLRGRVVAQGSGPPPDGFVEIEAPSVDPALSRLDELQSVVRARVGESFALTDLVGARQLRVRSTPSGWVVTAIRAGDRNLLDTPIDVKSGDDLDGIEIVITRDVAVITGAIEGASVLLFPENLKKYRDLRRVARWVRPDQNGRFTVDDLLPGSYLVVAATDVDDAQWANADYLEQYRARATRVTLSAGDRKSIDLAADPR